MHNKLGKEKRKMSFNLNILHIINKNTKQFNRNAT